MSEKYYKVSDTRLVCDPWEDHDVHQYTAEEIAQSINAIPIEWIEQYMNKFQLHGVCGDEYFIMHNMLCAWEWEKENEQTKI